MTIETFSVTWPHAVPVGSLDQRREKLPKLQSLTSNATSFPLCPGNFCEECPWAVS